MDSAVLTCWLRAPVPEEDKGHRQRLLYVRKLKMLTCLFKCQSFLSVLPLLPASERKRKNSAKVTSLFHVLVSSSAHFGPSLRNHGGDAALCLPIWKTLNVGKQDVWFSLSYLLFKNPNFCNLKKYHLLFFHVEVKQLCRHLPLLPLSSHTSPPLLHLIVVAFKCTTSDSVCCSFFFFWLLWEISCFVFILWTFLFISPFLILSLFPFWGCFQRLAPFDVYFRFKLEQIFRFSLFFFSSKGEGGLSVLVGGK